MIKNTTWSKIQADSIYRIKKPSKKEQALIEFCGKLFDKNGKRVHFVRKKAA